jgi:hypothetical protein
VDEILGTHRFTVTGGKGSRFESGQAQRGKIN